MTLSLRPRLAAKVVLGSCAALAGLAALSRPASAQALAVPRVSGPTVQAPAGPGPGAATGSGTGQSPTATPPTLSSSATGTSTATAAGLGTGNASSTSGLSRSVGIPAASAPT